MSKIPLLVAAAVLLAIAVPTLQHRWVEENASRQVALVVDWKEARDLADRQIPAPLYVLQALRSAGVQGVLFPPLTLKEVVRGGPAALSQSSVEIPRSDLGEQALQELSRRSVAHLESESDGGSVRLRRPQGDFEALGDIEIGYDAALLALARDQGLAVFVRVNGDPWLNASFVLPDHVQGVLFTSDDPPGGIDAAAAWGDALRADNRLHLWVEFKPTRAATQIAQAEPSQVVRLHTIPTAELKDMRPAQQEARWLRAVQERSCRILLFRPAPSESWSMFLTRLDGLRRALIREGWTLHLPEPHLTWLPTPYRVQWARSAVAFFFAVFAPLLGIALARRRQGASGFLTVVLVSWAGALLVAAAANMPETRLELMPFRGIKAALILPWLGSFIVLYPPSELKRKLLQPLSRLDLMAGLLLVGLIGYGIVRSGNAAPAWRANSEQHVRDALEKTLNVRPRFKEFAVGYPLLLLGFLLAKPRRARRRPDARLLMGIGMIGPISLVNTFCHLHSPLRLAFERSLLGLFIGSLVGAMLYFLYCRWEDTTA